MYDMLTNIYLKCRAGLFDKADTGWQISSALIEEQIRAAVFFVESVAKSEDHANKCVYKSLLGDTLTTARIKVVLDRRWLSDDVSATTN